MKPLLLRLEDAARELSLSRAKLASLVGRGEIASLKIGRSRRIAADTLAQWVRAQTAKSSPPPTQLIPDDEAEDQSPATRRAGR
jgi:excisionase family DNA binding protein